MATFVALLRGVNVGKAVFRAAKGTAAKHATDIASALARELNVEVSVVVKSA